MMTQSGITQLEQKSTPVLRDFLPHAATTIAGLSFISLILSSLYTICYGWAIGFPFFTIVTPTEIIKNAIFWVGGLGSCFFGFLLSLTRYSRYMQSIKLFKRLFNLTKVSNIKRKSFLRISHQNRWRVVFPFLSIIGLQILVGIYLYATGNIETFIYPAYMTILGVVMVATLNTLMHYKMQFRYRRNKKLYAKILLFVFACFTTVAVVSTYGFIIGFADMRGKNAISYLSIDGGSREAVIVRMVERGVLIRPCNDPFIEFFTWDAIKSIKMSPAFCGQ